MYVCMYVYVHGYVLNKHIYIYIINRMKGMKGNVDEDQNKLNINIPNKHKKEKERG